MTLLCVCGVNSFIPELEHQIYSEKKFHGLFSKKKPLKSDSCIQIHEMKLRSTSSAEENFPDEITWITWKTKQNLEIWPLLNSLLEKWVWEGGPKIDLAPALLTWKHARVISNTDARKGRFGHWCAQPERPLWLMHATHFWAIDKRKVLSESRMHATYISDERNPFNHKWQDLGHSEVESHVRWVWDKETTDQRSFVRGGTE